MLVTAFAYDWEYWELRSKVTFDGVAKTITVNSGVTSLDIRVDVYTEWVQWVALPNNNQYLFAMRFTGLDPIPGGVTGDTYFLTNGWKLIYDPRIVRVTGVLFSDDYDTPYYFLDGSAVYPAQVSSVVNTVNVGGGGDVDTAAIAQAVWTYMSRTLTNSDPVDFTQLMQALYIINEGVKKASILIPHTDTVGDIPTGDIPEIYVLETETPDPTSNLVWESGGL